MRAPPTHLPLVETVGLALTVLAFVVPEARARWMLRVVELMYFYCVFWWFVDTHQRGLLTKSVPQIYQAVRRSPRRTRIQGAAFSIAGAVLIVMYL